METLQTILLVVQVMTAFALIVFILLQHGKGADAGAAFGSGASATVFGARGTGNFLTRTTTILALVFLLNSLTLAWIAKERVGTHRGVIEINPGSVISDTVPAESQEAAPAVPETEQVTGSATATEMQTETPNQAPPDEESDVPELPEQ